MRVKQALLGLGVLLFAICSPVNAQTCPKIKFMTNEKVADEKVSIRFVGDLTFQNASHTRQHNETLSSSLAETRPFLMSSDVLLGNLEGVMIDRAERFQKIKPFVFRFEPTSAKTLKENGFSVLSVANNHAKDFGEEGIRFTLKHLKDSGIHPAGVKKQITEFKVKGLEIKVLGFGFYSHQNQIQDLKESHRLIAASKAGLNPGFTIVTFHGGAEGERALVQPNKAEIFLGENRGNSVAFARAAVEAGANLVIGHGPHVLRAVECYKGVPIFYSMGNFLSAGGLSIQGASALSGLGGVKTNRAGHILEIEFLPLVFDVKKYPRVDPKRKASDLINKLGSLAVYTGEFLRVED